MLVSIMLLSCGKPAQSQPNGDTGNAPTAIPPPQVEVVLKPVPIPPAVAFPPADDTALVLAESQANNAQLAHQISDLQKKNATLRAQVKQGYASSEAKAVADLTALLEQAEGERSMVQLQLTEANAKVAALVKKSQNLRADKRGLKAENEDMRRLLSELTGRLASLQVDHDRLTTANLDLSRDYARLERRLDRANSNMANLSKMENEITRLKAQLSQADVHEGRLLDKLEELSEQLAAAKRAEEHLQRRLERSQTALTSARTDNADLQKQLAAGSPDLVVSLKANVAKLNQAIDTLEDKLAQTTHKAQDVAGLKKQVTHLEAAVERLQEERDDLAAELKAIHDRRAERRASR